METNTNNSKLENILLKIFLIALGIVIGALTLLGFIYSYKNIELVQEYVFKFKDNVFFNIIWVFVFVAMAILIKTKAVRITGLSKINLNYVALALSIISIILSIMWVLTNGATPQADQWTLCEAASEINKGDYSLFNQGEYVARNQHQLGMVTLLRIIFTIFGDWNYIPLKILNCIGVGLTIFYSFKVAEILTNNKTIEVITLVLTIICLPLYFYTSFIYGEILSISFTTVGIYLFFLNYKETNYKRLVALSIVILAMLYARKNTIIVIIAMLGITIVKLLIERKKKYLLILVAIVIGVVIKSATLTAMYSSHFPEDAKEMPSILYIAMGTNNYEDRGGWYDGMHIAIFERNNYDPKAASEDAKQVIIEFLKQCIQNPVAGLKFYATKTLSQWIAPMYQGLVMNNNITDEQSWIAHFIYYDSRAWKFMDGFMNILQLIVYTSTLYLIIYSWKHIRKMEFYMGLIAVWGGFLFSIIWEAKTRYVFPYFIILIPYAAIGLGLLIDNICDRLQKS